MRMVTSGWLVVALFCWLPVAQAETYYVRQAAGDDARDGKSPETAWHHFSKLAPVMRAGDTAYVGPGLYREAVNIFNNGLPEKPITFIADPTGARTGDPPGPVVIAGSDPADSVHFTAQGSPGVYQADLPPPVLGVVEMDGNQRRYLRVTITKEYLVDKMPPVDVVAKIPSSFYYDQDARKLFLHTSDDRPPASHEIELMHRGAGIGMSGRHFVTVIGFTFRHFGDSGINFFQGSGDGVAIGNTSYGSRQGIRIYNATNVLVAGNQLFRNENCGAYFAAGSLDGRAIGNVSYENIKGLRWSSNSHGGIAADNVLFDNRERGLSIEEIDHIVATGNRIVGNAESQLLVIPPSTVHLERNCYATRTPEQLLADFFYTDHYRTLRDYQAAKHEDLSSREGDCGPLPDKVDVHAIHRESVAYVERMSGPRGGESSARIKEPSTGWWDRLRGVWSSEGSGKGPPERGPSPEPEDQG